MKRTMALLLALALMLAGCGQPAESIAANSDTETESTAILEAVEEQPSFYAEIPDDVNPYTGQPKTAEYPQGIRGVAVMINNVQAALPQSGINSADLLYEMVTESGITRLMAVYRNYSTMPTVGPIRSARDQHVQIMLPLNTLYAHIGGSTYANAMLDAFKYTNSRSIDGKYKNYYWIDAERRATRAQEHCVYTNGETFAEAVNKYELDIALGEEPSPVFNWTPWNEEPRALTGGPATDVYVRFSGYAYSEFVFNESTGRYVKYEFGGPEVDVADGGNAYSADNVFVLFAQMDKYPDGVLTSVNFAQQGTGLYFCGGRYEMVRWMKGTGEQPLRILDSEGHETDIQVNPGQSYVAVVGVEQIENMHINSKPLAELGL